MHIFPSLCFFTLNSNPPILISGFTSMFRYAAMLYWAGKLQNDLGYEMTDNLAKYVTLPSLSRTYYELPRPNMDWILNMSISLKSRQRASMSRQNWLRVMQKESSVLSFFGFGYWRSGKRRSTFLLYLLMSVPTMMWTLVMRTECQCLCNAPRWVIINHQSFSIALTHRRFHPER